MNISFYKGVKDNKGTTITINDVLTYIKKGNALKLQQKLREIVNVEDKEDKLAEIKQKFDAVTWSGIFQPTRLAKNLKEYTGLICFDIDKLDHNTWFPAWQQIEKDSFTFFAFRSPSGNGIKFLVKVPKDADLHLQHFNEIKEYYKKHYNIKVDESGKDICRLCFLPFDPDFYYNEKSKIWQAPTISNIDKELDNIKAFTDQKQSHVKGSRNSYVHLFACNCNRKGIDITDCVNYVLGFSDLPAKEVEETINKAYSTNVAENGQYKKGRPGKKNIKAEKQPDGFIKFWKERYNPKTDETNFSILYNELIEFLSKAGFFRLTLKNDTYQFIYFKNNVCKTVGTQQMQDYAFDWCIENNRNDVLEMLRRGSEKYFSDKKMSGLPLKHITFHRDTQTESFFYYRNTVVKVTKEIIEPIDYDKLNGAVWESSIQDRDFERVKSELPSTKDGRYDPYNFPCEMASFICKVASNPKNLSVDVKTQTDRFHSICSAIGYMLHSYKTKIGKAIVAVDHKMPADRSEQNGGTGKSIVGNSFKWFRKITQIDGRNFREEDKFNMSDIDVDTRVVVIADCKHNLDFGYFFVPITQDMSVEKKHQNKISLSYAESPKFWFDSNFTFRGEGPSFRRRQHVIEFDDYYDENNTPFEDFGHFLFDDWDKQQWLLFDNFYIECVQTYLSEGLMPYPGGQYEERKLLVDCPMEFIDWLEAKNEGGHYINVRHNDWIPKKELLSKWNSEALEYNLRPAAPHSFTKWVKKYCTTRKIKFASKKTNGKEFYCFGNEPKDNKLF